MGGCRGGRGEGGEQGNDDGEEGPKVGDRGLAVGDEGVGFDGPGIEIPPEISPPCCWINCW